jgi:hypothetical protein
MTRDTDEQSTDSDQNSDEKLVNAFTDEIESILANNPPSERYYEPHTDLEDLACENVNFGSTDRLEFVLEQLAESDELRPGLQWSTYLWDSVTVEELIGALLEADHVLGLYREQAYGEYEPAVGFKQDGEGDD